MTNDPVLAVAVRAAHRAASVIVDAARDLKRRPSYARDQGDVAFDAGIEAENAIISTLRTAFPEHAITGKEAGEIVSQLSRPAASNPNVFRWIVDPIDGALNFLHGYPFYAVSIALCHGPDVTHSVVLDPVRSELYTAVKGKGALQNDAPIRASTCVRIDDALVGAAFPPSGNPKLAACLPVFAALATRCAGVHRSGACALDLAYVAAGRLDGFWMTGLRPSEVAAGALIVREAGGRVGDLAGGGDVLRANDVIAAAPGVFNALRETIAAAAPPR